MLVLSSHCAEERINQIRDPETGNTVGGVTVRYDAASNNFTFTTGTRGDDSTIKVKGTARLGLDDVALGVGSVPQIFNLTPGNKCGRCGSVC